jgi:transcriptional regulator with XRE-family HTH domain
MEFKYHYLLEMKELEYFIFAFSKMEIKLMSDFTYNRIKEILAKKGKKNVELARDLDVDPRTVSSWCSNDSQPEYTTLFKISEILNVEAGELLTLRKDLRKVDNKKSAKDDVKKKARRKK